MDLVNARLALVRNEALHEEIVQELAAEFFRSVSKERIWADVMSIGDNGKSIRTSWANHWLNRVHKRLARRLGLREAKEYLLRGTPGSGGNDDGGEEPPLAACLASPYSSPEEIVSAREILSALEPALATLSKEECSILRDRIDGLSYPEIAENLGITEEAARSSMHRLRKHKLPAPNKNLGFPNAHRPSKKTEKPAPKAATT
jgi:RNA polymerase sigma factor (sigma-70 family)